LLVHGAMTRRLLFLAALALVLATVRPARADGFYLGVGLGPGAILDDEIASSFSTEDQVGGRIILGTRNGNFAIEASLFGTDFAPIDATFVETHQSSLSAGAGVKLYMPLGGGLEVYVRGGLDKTWISESDLEGRGYDYGTGVQLALRVFPRMQTAAWLDVGRQVFRLFDSYGNSTDGQLTMITLGFSFGSKL
jgi:hypothetical protein